MAELPPTRASLLFRLQDLGNESAWKEFVDLYTPIVYGYARKQGLQDADAADLTQEVLGAVAGAVGRLEYHPSRGSFRNWLFTVVRRKLSNWRRSQKIRRDVGDGSDNVPEGFFERYPARERMEEQWHAEWEERVFAWACGQVRRNVSHSTWQAFWRTAIDDQPGQQVAADLGMSVAAVYRARSRVLSRLKQLVDSVQGP